MDLSQSSASAAEHRSPIPSRPHQRTARSRDGCLTCKRRKVKCDELRPRCSHCERLNMECKWQSASGSHRKYSSVASGSDATPVTRTPYSASPSGAGADGADGATVPAIFQPSHAVTQMFDYASFMWDGSDVLQQLTPDVENGPTFDSQAMQGTDFVMHSHGEVSQTPQVPSFHSGDLAPEPSEPSTMSETSPQASQEVNSRILAESHRLMDYFIHAVTPPILAEVETQKKWFAMRQTLVKMASASRMVRWAILAFSNLMLCRRDGAWMASQQDHYGNAAAEVAAYGQDLQPLVQHSAHRENFLATLFFLSYVDILEGRIETAHSNLKRAHTIFQQGQKETFASVEKQFLLWIRLLDARAVSAGGEGLFLSKDEEELLVKASPASFGGESTDMEKEDNEDGDVEDVLFQVLYQPGIMFFQKVQSFMGRISKIDPWHRQRGTVEDEIEVMNEGAIISEDLRKLYEQRPLLMDYAVAGKLVAPHVSANLAFTITRAFRTYLSNYYASKIHLHRVAYKMFPLTKEAVEAVDHIRRLTGLLTEGLDREDALPVNMLWPLLMLGSEEQDPRERAWIKSQILRMEKIAGNAKVTAQVLEEVQARQDATKTRVDIRAVMHDIFNSSFAIV